MAYAIWNPATYYVPNDIVDYQGQLYVASLLQPNLNQTPAPVGTTYWGVFGGGVTPLPPPPLPGYVQSVTANGPGAGISTGGTATNVTLGAYQWPQLQLSSIANSVSLPSPPVVSSSQVGTVLGIDMPNPPALLFTSTFPASLALAGGYSNALFNVTFLDNINLFVSSSTPGLTYNIQIFPQTVSGTPPAGTTNSYSLCSAPIVFNTITTNGSGYYPLVQKQPFTVPLNFRGTAFQTVYWYAVNTTPGQVTAWLLSSAGAVANIQWSGFGWNAANTATG